MNTKTTLPLTTTVILAGLALLGQLSLLGCLATEVERPPASLTGTTYIVAPDGDDSNPGTEATPWQTIQHAAETLAPGDTVYARAGVYHEAVSIEVSGSATTGYITFQNYPGEIPILDGTGLSDPDGVNALYVDGQNYLVIQGFEIRNYTTTERDALPVGIQITGDSHHIQLLDNHLHHIETHAPVDADLLGADAHGIAVYGNSDSPIHALLIEGNELRDLILGSSEALVLNGNVMGFTITHNLIHDCDNIAIDLIGFEETAPTPALDQARDGLVSDNTIYNIDTLDNPAYGGEQSAGGIYVDGGTRITIERNRVHSSNLGIEIASEHSGRATTHITARNNLIYHNTMTGIALGGYDTERGSATDCAIVNNTLYHNDSLQDGNGELMLQFDTWNNIIKNNIFYANAQSLFISNGYTQNSGNVVDYNLYFAPAGEEESAWQWKNTAYTGFDAYRAATGNDAHSLFADPRFTDESAPDLHLRNDSPARDAGETLAAAGASDFDGDPRISGDGLDIGADEVPATTSDNFSIFLPLVIRPIGVSARRRETTATSLPVSSQ